MPSSKHKQKISSFDLTTFFSLKGGSKTPSAYFTSSCFPALADL